MDDKDLFELEPIKVKVGCKIKSKYLLKKEYQKRVLTKVRSIAKELALHKKIDKVWIGGSIVKKQLGKYAKRFNERLYSDIDLFVLFNCKLTEINREEVGLVRKLYTAKINGKVEKYYRTSVSDSKKMPLKIFDRFSVDIWSMSPDSYKKDLKKFPNLLIGAIEIN